MSPFSPRRFDWHEHLYRHRCLDPLEWGSSNSIALILRMKGSGRRENPGSQSGDMWLLLHLLGDLDVDRLLCLVAFGSPLEG